MERRRQDWQLRCDTIKREAAEKRQQYDAAVAEQNRQMQEQAKLLAERRQQQEEAAKQQAIIDAKPVNRLFRGYQYYAHVKFCNQVREGYLVKYVNDLEMERAEKAIKALVDKTTAEDTSIDTDYVWKEALKAVKGKYANDVLCRNSLVELFNLSPEPVYPITKPGSESKDFSIKNKLSAKCGEEIMGGQPSPECKAEGERWNNELSEKLRDPAFHQHMIDEAMKHGWDVSDPKSKGDKL